MPLIFVQAVAFTSSRIIVVGFTSLYNFSKVVLFGSHQLYPLFPTFLVTQVTPSAE